MRAAQRSGLKRILAWRTSTLGVRAAIVFPSDALSGAFVAYIHVLFEPLPCKARLYPGSKNTFRSQWDAVMLRLGVPHSQAERGATHECGYTPSCMMKRQRRNRQSPTKASPTAQPR
mmetsp:Transcript_23485/g.55420  ORF Transcript_23485/g.55420 Transcript_23485/m.55420 type:complete len:117 (-) Transcript_23485:73-423(-)